MRDKIFNLKTFFIFFTVLFIVFYVITSKNFVNSEIISFIIFFIIFIVGLHFTPQHFLYMNKIYMKGTWYKKRYKKWKKFNDGASIAFTMLSLVFFIVFSLISLLFIIGSLNENPIDFESIYISVSFSYLSGYFWHTSLKLDGVRKEILKQIDDEE